MKAHSTQTFSIKCPSQRRKSTRLEVFDQNLEQLAEHRRSYLFQGIRNFVTLLCGLSAAIVFFRYNNLNSGLFRKQQPSTYENLEQPVRRLLGYNIQTMHELSKCNKIWWDSRSLKKFAEPKKVYKPECTREFMGYKSSRLELYMIDHVADFQGKEGESEDFALLRYCNFMNSPYVKSAVLEFLNIMEKYQNLTSFDGEDVNTDIFSTMTFRITCQDGVTEEKEHYIEPLLGLTRHPLARCSEDSWLNRLGYIVLQSFQDDLFYRRMKDGGQIKFIGMDLGASSWDDRDEETKTRWFYDNYEKRGVEFDRMLMWGGRTYHRDQIYGFEPKYISSFQYFNTFADLNPNAAGNPLRVLHKIARVEDFVMVKLDINQPMEINIVMALLESPNALAVIDEFFFEHHTTTQVMKRYWGINTSCKVRDTYNIFLQLRHSGVRAHGWP